MPLARSLARSLAPTCVIAGVSLVGAPDARAQAFVAGDPASGVCYFTSIQQALDGVPAGSTIYVEAGIYSESLTVDKEITVIASHLGCSAPAPVGSNVIVSDVAPLTVATPPGANVEFQQFTFRDSLGANVSSSGANLKLVRSTSMDAAGEGISPAVDHTTGTQPVDLEFCARPNGLDWDDGAFERGCP